MIYLAIPNGGTVASALLRLVPNAGTPGAFAIDADRCSSAASDNHNAPWCQAWNQRLTHGYTKFALQHADVIPITPRYLDVMAQEMDEVNADILSVVIPLKDHCGLTSTGILGRDPLKRNVQRLTMTEIFDLPETFSIEDTHRPSGILVVNTGLSMYRINDWFGTFPGFNLWSTIQTEPDGSLASRFWPEDWEMGRWADEQGLRVFATRKVALKHVGTFDFENSYVWGKWKTDETYREIAG